MRRSPLIKVTVCGMVTEAMATELMMMLPVTLVHVARASRSLWLAIWKPTVLLQVLLPDVWATPRRWLATISEEGSKRRGRRSNATSPLLPAFSGLEGECVPCTALSAANRPRTIDDVNIWESRRERSEAVACRKRAR